MKSPLAGYAIAVLVSVVVALGLIRLAGSSSVHATAMAGAVVGALSVLVRHRYGNEHRKDDS